MSKLELSINVKYVSNWSSWEGLREFISNGRDAEIEFGAPLKVTYYNNTLRIENEGAELKREAILMGTSSKAERQDTIGKFGEGIALAALALVRGGRTVKIRTGDEVWRAFIARSEKYDADVLCFDIKDGNEDKKRVRVEINPVSEEDWAMIKDRFLFLNKDKDTATKAKNRVETGYGDLLLDEKHKGQIFVKGVYIQTDQRLTSGYNFTRGAEIDRDRKMVSSWDLQWVSGQIWMEAIARRPDLLDPFFNLMLEGKTDVAGLEHNANYSNKDVRQQVVNKFTAQFGKDAVPVSSLSESAEVEHLGKRGIVVSKSLGALLATTLGDKETLQKQLREEVVRTLSWGDLTATAKDNLTDAVKLVGAVRADCALDLVDIVDFRSATLLGQYKDGRILIATRILEDREETLATLVHEYSHREGLDGEKGHVAAIENLWRDIVKYLRSGLMK